MKWIPTISNLPHLIESVDHLTLNINNWRTANDLIYIKLVLVTKKEKDKKRKQSEDPDDMKNNWRDETHDVHCVGVTNNQQATAHRQHCCVYNSINV